MSAQITKIITYLEKGKPLTALQALKQFGCMRLAARIHELRDLGYNIQRSMIEKNGKKFARYWYDINGDLSTRRAE